MKNLLSKKILIAIIPVFLFNFLVGLNSVRAEGMADKMGLQYATNIGLPASEEDDVKDMAVSIIEYLLTFLGLIAVVIILWGGFMWMTAAGNDDRVGKAKNIIKAGVIGLIIIIAAFAIVQFVINFAENVVEGDMT